MRGKVASSLAFSLMLQLALLPLLMAMGAFCLLQPAQLLWVAALHFGLSAQGVTLGILGAVRARSIAAAVGNALSWWVSVLLGLGAFAYVVALLVGLLYVVLNVVIAAIVGTPGLVGHRDVDQNRLAVGERLAADSARLGRGFCGGRRSGRGGSGRTRRDRAAGVYRANGRRRLLRALGRVAVGPRPLVCCCASITRRCTSC